MKPNPKQKVKIETGEWFEYVPSKEQSYLDTTREYKAKLFDWIEKKGNTDGFIDATGYLVKPDGKVDIDLYRVDSQRVRDFQDKRQTLTKDQLGDDFLPWTAKDKRVRRTSVLNLEKLKAHHLHGLMSESPFLAGLSPEECKELVTQMFESNRKSIGTTGWNQIDLEDLMHQNPYEKSLLEHFRKIDPDAFYKNKNGKWVSDIYKGTGIHDLLAEHRINTQAGGTLFSPDLQKMLRNAKGKKGIALRLAAWKEWYDLTDEPIQKLLLQAQIDPRNIRSGFDGLGNLSTKRNRKRIFKQLLDSGELDEFTTKYASLRLFPSKYKQNALQELLERLTPDETRRARLAIQKLNKKLQNELGSYSAVVPSAVVIGNLIGIDMSMKGNAMNREEYEKNPTPVNWFQHQLSRIETAAETWQGGSSVWAATGAAVTAPAGGVGGVPGAVSWLGGEAVGRVAGTLDVGIEAGEALWNNRDYIYNAVTDKENQELFLEAATQGETYRQLAGMTWAGLKQVPGAVAGGVSGYAQEKVNQVGDIISGFNEQSGKEAVETSNQSSELLNPGEGEENIEERDENFVKNL